MSDASDAAKHFADNWSKPKPDTAAHAALVHAFETGYSHGYKRAQTAINELRDVLTIVLHEWEAPEVYQAQIAEVLGVTRPD